MTSTYRSIVIAMLCSAAVSAEFVSGKATRDALFLTSLPYTALPTMLIVTAVCSMVLVAAYARAAARIAPKLLVPGSFAASGVLFLGEWLVRSKAPWSTAIVVYLHVSAAGPLLASGFWLISSERFDPRTAKRRFGRIAGAGTLGGLLGALLAERVAAVSGAPDMLLFLAAFSFVAAWLARRLALDAALTAPASSVSSDSRVEASAPRRSGLRTVAETPYLRRLVALVLLGTTSAALLDYLFKANAVQTFGPGDNLLRFFALYYAVVSLITFVLQTAGSRLVLERFGLALTTSTPSIALIAGGAASLLAPGFGSLLVARTGESLLRGSWFRAGYELFYTPIPAGEKRAAKSVIDVGFDRLGDALGGGLVRMVVLLVPAAQSVTMLALAMAGSAGAIVAASRLNRWYLRSLEKSLLNRAGPIDFSATADDVTRRVLGTGREPAGDLTTGTDVHTVRGLSVDPEVQDLLALRTRNRKRAIEVLTRQEGLSGALVTEAIPLLAFEPLSDYALFALRKVAEERIGQLVDALLDPNQDDAIRRRLVRVFSVCVSQRAADGLLLALEDERFDVRFESARALRAIVEKNPRIGLDRDRILEIVRREVAAGRPMWETLQLLDGFAESSPIDGFVRDRAGQSLDHVFTLLSLVLPREPLRVAFRSLRVADRHLRGTALEYLEGVLPPAIRQELWPYLVGRPSVRQNSGHAAIIGNLLQSSQSLTLKRFARGWTHGRVAGFGGI